MVGTYKRFKVKRHATLEVPSLFFLRHLSPEKSRPACTAMTYANIEAELKASYPAGHERDSLPVADHPQDDF